MLSLCGEMRALTAIKCLPDRRSWFSILGVLVLGHAWCSPCSAQVADANAEARVAPQNTINPLLVSANAPDADLNAMAVVTPDRICTVGNCGVVLLSENGGRTWAEIPTPTVANLYAVEFMDSEHGIVAGGLIGGYSQTSRGVILQTSDGGHSWQLQSTNLPRITTLRLVDDRLIACGDFCTARQTGVFESGDRGATWRSAAGHISHAAAVAASTSTNSVGPGPTMAIDRSGQGHLIPGPGQLPISFQVPVAFRDLAHVGQAWIGCGENGSLYRSNTGRTWSPVTVPLSEPAHMLCDWNSISQLGAEVWVVGSPGSVILHSSDGGHNWTINHTGQSLPLRDVQFLDHHRGWAVGAQGTILATRDGGDSWYAQRAGGRRLGVLSVVTKAQEIPWAPMASASWDDQVTGATLIFDPHANSRDLHEATPSSIAQLQSLAPHMGAGIHWTRSTKDCSKNQCSDRLAVALMTWQPSVVLTHDAALPTEKEGQGRLPDWLSSAADHARDPAGDLRSTASELGLTPWNVEKVVVVTEDEHSQYSEQSQRVLRTLGLTIWDILLPLPPEFRQAAHRTHLRTHWTAVQNRAASTSLMGGVAPDPATIRNLRVGEIGNYQLVMGRTHRRKSVRQLLARAIATNSAETLDLDAWESDLAFVVRNTPNAEVQPMLWDLAQDLRSAGQLDGYQAALKILVSSNPSSDAASRSMLELLKLTASEEYSAWGHLRRMGVHAKPISLASQAGRQNIKQHPEKLNSARTSVAGLETGNLGAKPWDASPFPQDIVSQNRVSQNSRTSVPSGTVALSNPSPPPVASHGVVSASAIGKSGPRAVPQVDVGEWFRNYDAYCRIAPELLNRPELKMLAYRMDLRGPINHSTLAGTDRIESLLSPPHGFRWSRVAAQERRFRSNRFKELAWLAMAVRTESRPTLDGELDEPFWTSVAAMQLPGPDSTSPSLLHWAYDAKYLYLGIQCTQPTLDAGQANPVKRIRDYDSNLAGQDYVQVTLDTDRDYSTSIQLAIAEDGRTYDRCDGVPAFNPKWHVFVESGAGTWTAEIAVELAHLTTRGSLVGDAWAVTAQRVLGDGRFRNWGHAQTREVLPQDAGLLLLLPSP